MTILGTEWRLLPDGRWDTPFGFWNARDGAPVDEPVERWAEVDDDMVLVKTTTLALWEAAGRPTPAPYVAPPAPPRFYGGADIAAAVDRWGASGDAALDALSSREWFALSAGVAADHPALSALLRAAGKTLADLDP